jgi:uncharacterized coiled-coil protein SlyX
MGAAVAHNNRTSKLEKCNIDATLTPLNQVLKGEGTVAERLANKLKVLTTKVRKDAVVAIELMLSASPEWFDGLTTDRAALHQHPKFRQWANNAMKWARQEFGQNIIDVALHMDESSPHMHVLAVPLTKDGRLCAKEVLARSELTRRQDSYAKAMEELGLSRGDPAKETKRRHIKLTEKPPVGGGKASELAAELVAANATIDKLQKQLQRLQGFNIDYSRQIANLEKRLKSQDVDLAKLQMDARVVAEIAATKKDAQALRENPENDPETAMALFLEKHKGLPWCTPQEAAVGTLVASAGAFAVLHLGRGRNVLFEFDSAEQVQELERGKQRDRGHDFGR